MVSNCKKLMESMDKSIKFNYNAEYKNDFNWKWVPFDSPDPNPVCTKILYTSMEATSATAVNVCGYCVLF
jgi:hypothetical protein